MKTSLSFNMPNHSLRKAHSDINFLKAYLYQALKSEFFDGSRLEKSYFKLNKAIDSLSENEVTKILSSQHKRSKRLDFFFLEKEEPYQKDDFKNYPKLFTELVQASFDEGGLMVLRLFNLEQFEIYKFTGEILSGPSSKITLLNNGKYKEIFSDEFPEILIKKYSLEDDSLELLKEIEKDCNEEAEFLEIGKRDRLIPLNENGESFKIENFAFPTTENEVKNILQSDSCNWYTSPELQIYYKQNKKLALLAIKKDPLAFSLLEGKLQKDFRNPTCALFFHG